MASTVASTRSASAAAPACCMAVRSRNRMARFTSRRRRRATATPTSPRCRAAPGRSAGVGIGRGGAPLIGGLPTLVTVPLLAQLAPHGVDFLPQNFGHRDVAGVDDLLVVKEA